jgi:glyoxylase-like metal-dependent hydrolase (beta-lactamase superfamily II)/8-oxo-dGTP pyrophosphatase MutT (NUDIX family)
MQYLRLEREMASPRMSAAVIMYREKPRLEVFWMRRSPKMLFQGGFYAFPGGQLEANEDARTGAVRELQEETGVAIEPAVLVDVGQWVTPAFLPRRFNTQLFLASCPDGQEPHCFTDENDFAEWIEPDAALRKWRDGGILMAPPIRHALTCLKDGLKDIQIRMKTPPQAQGEPPSEIEMRAGITLVPLRTPTLPPATHTNCYILGDKDVIVVDPASPDKDEQARLDRIIESRGVRVGEIWLTHRHGDHVGGANHFRERWNVPIAAHEITAKDLAGVVDVDRTFRQNEVVELPGDPELSIHIHHTPGHARGHVCIFESRNGSLLTGDLMAGFGTIIIDPPEGHMATYLDSLRRMQALPVTTLFPAHGPVMANAKARIQEYIDHRLDRERNILTVWNGGAREPAAIVKEVYKDVAPAMYGFAERSVLAHLEKLQEEGRI